MGMPPTKTTKSSTCIQHNGSFPPPKGLAGNHSLGGRATSNPPARSSTGNESSVPSKGLRSNRGPSIIQTDAAAPGAHPSVSLLVPNAPKKGLSNARNSFIAVACAATLEGPPHPGAYSTATAQENVSSSPRGFLETEEDSLGQDEENPLPQGLNAELVTSQIELVEATLVATVPPVVAEPLAVSHESHKEAQEGDEDRGKKKESDATPRAGQTRRILILALILLAAVAIAFILRPGPGDKHGNVRASREQPPIPTTHTINATALPTLQPAANSSLYRSP